MTELNRQSDMAEREMAGTRPAVRSGRFASLPNILTYGRILAIPALVACFFVSGDWGRWTAMWIFIAAGVSDFLDGYLARAWQQQSSIGRMLDPIADKLIVAAALLMLAAYGTIAGWSLWAGVIILCREILVSGLREFLGTLAVSVPVTRLAKWKTVLQMVAIGFLLAGPAGDKVWPYTTEFGLTLLWIAALLTLYTGYDYLRAAVRHVIKEA
jgi:cardiolipin synthase (CMP-forming)